MTGTVLIESNSLFFHALAYFWRNIETCALKVFKCERLFVNSTALNLSHVAILMMMISFLKCAFFRTLNFLMYIACSLNSILNAKMHGPCREHNLQRNFTGPVMAPSHGGAINFYHYYLSLSCDILSYRTGLNPAKFNCYPPYGQSGGILNTSGRSPCCEAAVREIFDVMHTCMGIYLMLAPYSTMNALVPCANGSPQCCVPKTDPCGTRNPNRKFAVSRYELRAGGGINLVRIESHACNKGL